jgi:hypothetical protein
MADPFPNQDQAQRIYLPNRSIPIPLMHNHQLQERILHRFLCRAENHLYIFRIYLAFCFLHLPVYAFGF